MITKYFFWAFFIAFVIIAGLMAWLSIDDFSTSELPSIFFIVSGMSSLLLAGAMALLALSSSRVKDRSDA